MPKTILKYILELHFDSELIQDIKLRKGNKIRELILQKFRL